MHPRVMACINTTLERFWQAELVMGPATFQFGHTSWVEVFNNSHAHVAALFARDAVGFDNLERAQKLLLYHRRRFDYVASMWL